LNAPILVVFEAPRDIWGEGQTTARQAINFAKTGGREKLTGEIRERMKLYQANHRYNQK